MSPLTIARTLLVITIALISSYAHADETSFGTPSYGLDISSIGTAAVAGSGDGYVAIWTASEDRLFARGFDREGRPLDETHLVGVGAHYDPPVVVRVGDRYRVLWMTTEFRYGLSAHLEVVDLDDRGAAIEGSARRLADDVFRVAAATDGARTLVVTDQYFVSDDGHLRWFLIEPSGDVRQGSIYAGDTWSHQVLARNGDFDVIWRSGSELWRFELFSGKLERVPAPGGAASFAATTDGETLWIATSYFTTTALTIIGPEPTRTVTLTTGRGLAVVGAWTVNGEVVVAAQEADWNFLVRADRHGNLLQLLDTKLDKGRLFGVVDGVDSLLVLAKSPTPGRSGSLSTIRMQRLDGTVSAPGTARVLNVIAGSQFGPVIASSSTGRSLLVWVEDGVDGSTTLLRGALLDDVSGMIGDPIEIAPAAAAVAVVASNDRFLVHYRTEPANDRVALIDFDGNIVSDRDFPFANEGFPFRWAWNDNRFVAVEGRIGSILLHSWDGTSTSKPFEVGRAEDPGDGWSAITSVSLAVGDRTVLVGWTSLVSHCFFPPCFEPRQVFVRLLDKETLLPVTEAIPVGERNHLLGVAAAWDGTRYGLFSESRGTLVRLTEEGAVADDEEIPVRGTFGFAFSPAMTIVGLDGAFAVLWYEQNWTPRQGIAMRVTNGDGSVSPIRAFPVLTHTTPLATASSGGDLWLAYTRMVPDDDYDGATRVFVRRMSDVPETAPPRAPRLRSAYIVNSHVALEWDDESDDEEYFDIEWSIPYPTFGSCGLRLAPADSTSARFRCHGPGPFTFRVTGWNAAGPGESSEAVTAVAPERKRGVRRE